MYFSLKSVLALISLTTAVVAQNASKIPEFTIQAEGITAKFIPFGARLTSLLVQDRDGAEQDVVVGYDSPDDYPGNEATNHTPIVGRYANRIRNGTFELNGQNYSIPKNDNKGLDTLHGGDVGYDIRNWTVVATNDSSITFSLLDPGFEGFPGTVLTVVTYAVSSFPSGPQGEMRPRFTASIVSHALDEPTPIMLSTHIYWNLAAFKVQDVLNDTTLWLPYSDRYIATDSILIPSGEIGTVASQPGLDFTSPKTIGDAVKDAEGLCGAGCTGVDNAFTIDRPNYVATDTNLKVLSLWSKATGIQMDVSTNQIGLQIYTCNGQDGTIPVKQSQQDRNGNGTDAAQFVEQYGCVVIEPQAYIDGINHPEWGVDKYEIFSPETGPLVFFAEHDFSTF